MEDYLLPLETKLHEKSKSKGFKFKERKYFEKNYLLKWNKGKISNEFQPAIERITNAIDDTFLTYSVEIPNNIIDLVSNENLMTGRQIINDYLKNSENFQEKVHVLMAPSSVELQNRGGFVIINHYDKELFSYISIEGENIYPELKTSPQDVNEYDNVNQITPIVESMENKHPDYEFLNYFNEIAGPAYKINTESICEKIVEFADKLKTIDRI